MPFERKGFENLPAHLLKKLLETMELHMLGLLGGEDDGEDE